MREILGKVVERERDGTQARIKGFLVGGKTGTAQKVEPGSGRYSDTKRTASFIGFLPLNDPKLLILVVIDEPPRPGVRRVVAAPAFNQIAVKTGVLPRHPANGDGGARRRPSSGTVGAGHATPVSTARTAGVMVMPDLTGLSMEGSSTSWEGTRSSFRLPEAGSRGRRRRPPETSSSRDGVLRDVHGGAAAEDRRRQGGAVRLADLLARIVPVPAGPWGRSESTGSVSIRAPCGPATCSLPFPAPMPTARVSRRRRRRGRCGGPGGARHPSPPLPVVRVPSTAAALPAVAVAFHGDPSAKLRVTGVTGTNGKTTVTYLIEGILAGGRSRPRGESARSTTGCGRHGPPKGVDHPVPPRAPGR